MFTVDLTANTITELVLKLQAKGISDPDINRLIKDTNAEEGIKDFYATGPFKALVIITPGKSTLVLGVKIEVDQKITSVQFPVRDRDRPFFVLSTGRSSTTEDSDEAYAHIINFQSWSPNPQISIITGRNGAGKTHLLEYMYHDLGGDYNDWVFFLDSKKSQEDFISFLNGYNLNKHYVVQRAKYPYLALLTDLNPKTTTLDFDDAQVDRYKYPYLQTLYQQVFGKQPSVGTKVIDKIEEKLRHLPREILVDDTGVNSIILQHVASSLPRDSEHACSFFSSILTCFYYLGKYQEFIGKFNLLLQQNALPQVEVTDQLKNGLLKWQLRNSDDQLHPYDGLSSGQQALFNFLTWGISNNLNKLGETDVPYKVMLLDEPDASLDPDLEKQMFAVLRGFADRGVQVIMTTHRTDTVSLASEGSVFTIKSKAIVPSTRLHALLRMTKNTRELVNLQTTVYVEGKDVPFYEGMYSLLKQWCDNFRIFLPQQYIPELQEFGTDDWRNRLLSMRYPLQFIQVPTKGGSTKEAHCAEVKNGVARGYHLGRTQNSHGIIDPSLRVPFGIIDKDNGNANIDSVENDAILKDLMVVPPTRYSKENFIFDPWIFLAALSDDDISNEINEDKIRAVFVRAKKYLAITANHDERNNVFKEYYATILGKDIGDLNFKSLKVVYYQGSLFRTLEYCVSQDFLDVPGHVLERQAFRLFKKDKFKSGKDLTEYAVSSLSQVQGMPQDLVQAFFRLNGKVIAHHNKFIKPPVLVTAAAAAIVPTLEPTAVVAYCHQMSYDNPLLNDASGALLIAAHKQGGMTLVNKLLEHDGSMRSDLMIRVTTTNTQFLLASLLLLNQDGLKDIGENGNIGQRFKN